MGSVTGQDAKSGAIAGAIGGVVSEVMAEAVLSSLSQTSEAVLERVMTEGLDQEQYMNLYQDQVQGQRAANIGLFGAAVVALLADQDVNISIHTATNAVENNLIPALVLGGLILWEAYEVQQAYVYEGADAAVRKLGFIAGT